MTIMDEIISRRPSLGEVVNTTDGAFLVMHPKTPTGGARVVSNIGIIKGDGYTLPYVAGWVAIPLEESKAVWAEGPDARWVVPSLNGTWIDPATGRPIHRVVYEQGVVCMGEWSPHESLIWLDEHGRALPATVEQRGTPPTSLELGAAIWAALMRAQYQKVAAKGRFDGRFDFVEDHIETVQRYAAAGDVKQMNIFKEKAREAML